MMLPLKRERAIMLCTFTILSQAQFGSSFLAIASPRENNLRWCPQATSALHAATSTTNNHALLVPPGILGPPEPLRSLKVGQYVNAFRTSQSNIENERIQFTIERVSHYPDIFHLKNFVTPLECEEIKAAAKASNMKEAETVTKDDASSRKNCSVTWLSSNGQGDKNSSVVASNLAASVANIFLSKDVLSHPSAGVEDLQVLRYDTGGEFVLHHDGEPRTLTVIYYINGVGGTWFPLAHTGNEEDIVVNGDFHKREPKNKAQAMDLIEGLEPGNDGLLVKGTEQNNDKGSTSTKREDNDHIAWVNEGDAIAFYNYKDDGSAQLDWKAIHCGLPTTKEEGAKWIANHWIRVNVLAEM